MGWKGICPIKEEMTNMKKRHLTLAVLAGLLSTGGGETSAFAGHAANLQSYTIVNLVDEAAPTINQFCAQVPEQSYDALAGDVKAVTRSEAAK